MTPTQDPGGAGPPARPAHQDGTNGGARPNGSGNGSGNGRDGKASGLTPGSTLVAVDTRVERALALATRQLAAEATGTVLLDAPVPTRRDATPPPVTRVVRAAPVVTVVDPDELDPAERKALGKLRAKKVRRILRHVSPWSVFKFSILFYLCLWLILLVAGVLLWRVAQTAGVVGNVERFYAKAAGEQSFELDGRSLFRAAAGAGVVIVLAATGFTVLVSVLFNLISDLTGGVRMSVVELETARRGVRTRRVASLRDGVAASAKTSPAAKSTASAKSSPAAKSATSAKSSPASKSATPSTSATTAESSGPSSPDRPRHGAKPDGAPSSASAAAGSTGSPGRSGTR